MNQTTSSPNKKVAILGAGGHTRSLINLLETNHVSIFGIYDDSFDPEKNETISTYRVLGRLSDLDIICDIVLSYGDNTLREKLYQEYQRRLLTKNLIHPTALHEKHVILGNSNQVFAQVIINSHAHVGNNNIINTRALLEHEVHVGDHNHISVGSILCGRVKIGNRCFIGAGAVVIDKITIADDVIIGANSVVINDIYEPGTYVGNPVRRIK
nr:acetyltransferase [Bacteroidota bacterium]